MAGSALAEGDDIIAAINVTPLVDITLVLLIIFMVTTSLMQYPVVPVELPRAKHTNDAPTKNIGIALDVDNNLYINGRQMTHEDALKVLKDEVRSDPNVAVTLSADAKIKYQHVMTVLDMTKEAAVKNFSLTVDFASKKEVGVDR